jgi:hypothetical protein
MVAMNDASACIGRARRSALLLFSAGTVGLLLRAPTRGCSRAAVPARPA